jgi:hypothetical protein
MKKIIGVLLGIGAVVGIGGYKFLESPRYGVYQACQAIKSKELEKVKQHIELNAIATQVTEYYIEKSGALAIAMSNILGMSVDSYVETKLTESIANAKEEDLKKLNCLGLMQKVTITRTGEIAEATFYTKIENAVEVPIEVEMQKEKNVWRVKKVKAETVKVLENIQNTSK